MQELTLDPFFWFDTRQLDFTPNHFVVTNTPATSESLLWVINNLKGRYSLIPETTNNTYDILSIVVTHNIGIIAFEDSTEAVFYELKWS
jgi:hypothetical protein